MVYNPACFEPARPDGAHASYIARSSSRFIDCHRRVSIINHLHCNRTAPRRSDIEAPGRFSASAYNSRDRQVVSIYNAMATMEMCRTPKCCHLSYPANGIRTAETRRRETDEITKADWPVALRCIASHRVAYALHHTLQRTRKLSNRRPLETLLIRIICRCLT